MKIECAACHKVYNINEKKLPDSKNQFAFPCPNCNHLISIDLQSDLENVHSSPPHDTKEREKKSELKTPHPKQHIKGENLKNKIFLRMKNLPSMPHVVVKAQQVMKNPNLGMQHLAQVLEKDPAMVTKILKTANSAHYGVAERISSIQNAVALLGNRAVEEIIFMSVASGFLDKMLEGYGLASRDMWRHSLTVAFGSRIIAEKKFQESANKAFLAGLLHDMGKIILDKYVFERKETFKAFLGDGQQTFLNAENKILGFDHSQIGSKMCRKWDIPDDLIPAIRFHHYPSQSNQDKLAYIVHVADCISILSGFGSGFDGLRYEMEENALEFLGLQDDDVRDTMCQAVEAVQNTEKYLPTK